MFSTIFWSNGNLWWTFFLSSCWDNTMDQAIQFPPPPFSPAGSSKGAEGSEGLPKIPTPPTHRQRPVELALVLRLVFVLKPEDSELHFLSLEDPIMVSRPTSQWQAKIHPVHAHFTWTRSNPSPWNHQHCGTIGLSKLVVSEISPCVFSHRC